MHYISTRGGTGAEFAEILLGGPAPDGGLYLPDDWPVFRQETIREFATERLAARPDAEDVRLRHASWVTGFVERAELRGPEMPRWLERTEIEHDNVRAALGWSIAQREAGLARRMVAGLWKFWWLHGHAVEGGAFAQAALRLSADLPDELARHMWPWPARGHIRGG